MSGSLRLPFTIHLLATVHFSLSISNNIQEQTMYHSRSLCCFRSCSACLALGVAKPERMSERVNECESYLHAGGNCSKIVPRVAVAFRSRARPPPSNAPSSAPSGRGATRVAPRMEREADEAER
eukprot:GHVU01025726.1.p4 GENE.GHVU01025726.1~~GHVU01025726.1.p4  ORF type:complete len:124 (+),score=6.30 GHVU01025726.1:1050-1421(+)